MPRIIEARVTGEGIKEVVEPIKPLSKEEKKDFSGFNSCFGCGVEGTAKKLFTEDKGLFCGKCLNKPGF